MKLPQIAFVAMVCVTNGVYASPAKRLPTLDDAFAVKSVGNISANPQASIIAVEIGGSITVTASGSEVPFTFPQGARSPVWSPDGALLGFYVTEKGHTQIAVWDRRTMAVHVVTQKTDGISPNPWVGIGLGSPTAFSWSPDSRQIAFVSRSMAGYEDIGKQHADEPIKVYDSASSMPYASLTGLFRSSDTWEASGQSPDSDMSPVRMRTAESEPSLARNHLYVVDITLGSTREIPNGEGCWYPAWSPSGRDIAVICDERPAAYPRTITDTSPGARLVRIVARSGERRSTSLSPAQFNGAPYWSPDGGTIAMVGQRRTMGFRLLQLYDVDSNMWKIVPTMGHSLAIDTGIRWEHSSKNLIVKVRNRFAYELWRISSNSAAASNIAAGTSYIRDFDVGAGNRVLFVADGATYYSRIYESAADLVNPILRLDPNKQLDALWFAPRLLVTWTNSRGEPVDGIMLLPPNYVAGKRYPVVIDVYPGLVMDKFRLLPTSQAMGDLTAARGYVVFYPALRTPHGAYGFPRDENYTEEARGVPGIAIMTDDFNSGMRYVDALGVADMHRICLFGHSNGGYTANLLITETNVAKCAVMSAAGNNLFMAFIGTPDGPGTKDERTNGNYYDNPESYLRLSPWFRLNRVNIPVLLFGGDKDWDWSLQMSAEYGSLRALGQDVTWIRYRDEEHYFAKPENIRDSFERVMGFFQRHLMN